MKKYVLGALPVLVVCFSFVVFQVAHGGLFTPPLCAILGVGCPEIEIRGFVAPNYEPVRELFHQHFLDGKEVGASVVAYVNGEKVVELYGGVMDRSANAPFSERTLTTVWSSGKAVAAIAIGILVDRGLLSYDKPIADYWPEYAQNGKALFTVSDLLSHRGAIPWLEEAEAEEGGAKLLPLQLETALDEKALSRLVEKSPAIWSHGEKRQMYHCIVGGFVLDQLVRRVDPQKRSMARFIREELAEPLGIEFYLGLSEEEDPELVSRLSTLYPMPLHQIFLRIIPFDVIPEDYHFVMRPLVPSLQPETDLHLLRALKNSSSIISRACSNVAFDPVKWLAADVPAAGGKSSAASLAKLASVMANGGEAHGVKLMSKETWQAAHVDQEARFDEALLTNSIMTVGGFGKTQPEIYPDSRYYGWGGNGGSLFLWHPELKIGFSYVMNAMHLRLWDHRSIPLARAVAECASSQQ
ncbi:Class A beta-lactamase-related serine hydrolase [Balamuthia mandrillaris]